MSVGAITSSPGPMPIASSARCSPAVAELTATACTPPPRYAANSLSNALVSGPVVTQPERMARATASISASVMSGRAKGKNDSGFIKK